MFHDNHGKSIGAYKLAELLLTLGPDARVMCNAVGNLAIVITDEYGPQHYVGFVDFNNEKLEIDE